MRADRRPADASDPGQGIVWQAHPKTSKSSVFMNTGLGSASGFKALTFDKAGNV